MKATTMITISTIIISMMGATMTIILLVIHGRHCFWLKSRSIRALIHFHATLFLVYGYTAALLLVLMDEDAILAELHAIEDAHPIIHVVSADAAGASAVVAA